MSRPDAPVKPKLDLTFYPAFCYTVSPTWSTWVKLTCRDVHDALRPHYHRGTEHSYTSSGLNPSLVLFYLNHPIQYVQLIGMVVAIEDHYENVFLFTLDDSSGATLDVVLRKPRLKKRKKALQHAPKTAVTKSSIQRDDNEDNSEGDDEEEDGETKDKSALLNILSSLNIGDSILAKGTLSTFRDTRQLSLLRITPITTTTQEIHHIDARTKFLANTLSRPWKLSESRQRKLRTAAESDKVEQGDRARKAMMRKQEQAAWENRQEDFLGRKYNEEEQKRARAADEAKQDGERVMRRRRAYQEQSA
ncbi:uncharacterized protein HMPREF1541_03939 [Cyphellophora europaea CBS 101466]|uniref:CST complex subunit Stn1 N-terminal domain-containing protein n=1 Tax=Cyphellophora europaea (strain CBS 101466) TaxID=1220924 RepID=W2S081_CYPE1|nr:uncharacterized protein HMPREF1541_03939 [Cyphellophora europaea CBS 101466]ETN42000.1 hypothetical protein HMPREF1541_03939 [Cyphellophora europaea CBS 101466]